MSKPVFFNSLKQAKKACEKLGLDVSNMRTMAEMTSAYNKAVSFGRTAVSKPQMAIANKPAAKQPIVDEIAGLKATAKAARSASDKVEAYSKLSAKLEANLKAEQDLTKQTEIRRELMAAQRSEAYARLAERQSNPRAVSVRNALAKADE